MHAKVAIRGAAADPEVGFPDRVLRPVRGIRVAARVPRSCRRRNAGAPEGDSGGGRARPKRDAATERGPGRPARGGVGRARSRAQPRRTPMTSPPREEMPIPPERLHERFTRFQALLGLAESRCAAGDVAAAAALAQVAARSVFPDHAGLFASPRLERLLVELGRRIAGLAPAAPPRPRPDGRRDVLHVLTYARPVGGDSRFVWRWMVEDRESRHSVAITTQSHYRDTFEVPPYLWEAAEASGGRLHELRAPASEPIAQALELRALCQGRDVVALHLWPDDVVPVLALADGCSGDRTLFLHHSDHTFWIGASVSHAIVHMRAEPE